MSEAIRVRIACEADLQSVKRLLDTHRKELGFVPLPALRRTLDRGWLYVAGAGEEIVGMIDWWARLDGTVVLYDIVVSPSARLCGIGRLLLEAMIGWAREHRAADIRLKCPIDLPANKFYARLGFQLSGHEAGKIRPLNCWSLVLQGGIQNVELSLPCGNLL